ncbi:putative A-kinase anchor protein 9 isoform X5 [Apostichopus japonicus]|uniref:Putative A-kinase anchor protein 9 isoform X5 n=1 Tax=Stichopus japonicus TaxID=307972 RepID=A0A2G8JSI6_STIJA|nr:putative A-kinase anchor protein 9 isoform X5 [Apostichopus japonicus]
MGTVDTFVDGINNSLIAFHTLVQQQSAEREQERDEFQREIRRLEELSGKDKPNNFEEEDIRRELQDTKEDLKAVKEDCEALSNQNQELETEVILKDETVHELTQQIKELERTLEQNKEIVEPLRAEKGSLEKEVVELRKLEEELTHEKDALHKQCSDQLLQISALQSKLDAHKHGLDETRQMSAFEEDEDEGKSLASVTLMQQLERRGGTGTKGHGVKCGKKVGTGIDGIPSGEARQSAIELISGRSRRRFDRGEEQQIDELTGQVLEAQRELEEVKDQLEDVKENEDEALKEDLEKNLEEKDKEIASLRDQIDEWKDQVEQITDRQDNRQHREESMQGSSETTMHLEEELKRLRALLAIREREIAQLEAQLMSLQGSPGRDKNIQEETVDRLQKEMEDKDLQLMQLKIQVDQAEETVFQAQQQLSQVSDLPRQNQQLLFGMEEVQDRHTKEIQDLKAKHKELSARREAEHKNEIERMMAAQEEDWKKIQQLEKDYEGKLTHIGKLSPGKTLQQKLDEIKKELTKQHQEHVADIQRTMAKEADERIEQLRAQMTQESLLMQQRHQHELEEAILRTNRDLMAAHAEEVAKIRDDHRQEVDRILATSPANMSQFSDINQLMQSELELAQLRGRPGGIGQELPSQADSGVSSGDATTEGLSDKLKDSPPEGPRCGLSPGGLENEKRALLDAIQSLKDLVTQLSGSQRDLNQDDSDWRGELLLTIQQVFQCEREALRAELSTNVAMSGDQNITDVQLLQRRIREQENFHKSAVEQIYGADRSSILGESRDLFSQNNALQEELQRSRQRLTQQLKALEEQSNKRERQLKRQLETMEHKYRQERILVEDLRTSLVLEKEKGEQLSEALQKVKGHEEELQEELSDLLTKIDKQIGDREAVESRLADVTILADTALAAFEAERSHNRSLNATLSEEKKASRSLNDAFETENRRVKHARNREQQIIKELHRELQQEKNKLVDAEKTAEKEALRSNALSRELEAIRSETVSEVQHEKAKFTELKTAIDVERTRCQELKTALQKEQVLNAQLQATMEQQRQQNADTSLQEKTLIAELQAKLDTSQAEVIDIQGQIKQLENSIRRKEGVLETERAQHKEVVSRERAASRQMKSSLDAVENKLEEVERQLISEQEKAARLKADKERLHQSLESQAETDKDKVSQRERERENEKRKQLERDREREMERQKQHDLELEHQLDQQKIRSLEEQVEDWKNHAQQTLEELQRLQDKQKYENEEDVEMQRELEMELQKSLERHSPAGKEAGPSGQRSRYHLLKEQLEAIRQRLQLIAVKEHEGLGLLRRMNQTVADSSSSTSQEIHTLERNLQEATAELKQIHGALVLQVETSTGVPASKARLNTRLLNQNAELSNYISKLSDEKSEMRRQLSQLEEQLWTLKQRQLHQTSTSPRGTRRDLDSLFAEEISSWERERLSTQNALRQAEREIIRLKLELEQNAANRESDVELLLSNGYIPEHQQQKFQRLYGKYLRAESFRKSLIYQKKYLLLLLGGFQDTEEASLALIAKMGGYPNPANMEQTNRRSKAFTKFRSAVRVCIAISRLKYLKKKWQRACGTSNHSTLQSLPTHHSVPSYPPSLPPVRHSSTQGPPRWHLHCTAPRGGSIPDLGVPAWDHHL